MDELERDRRYAAEIRDFLMGRVVKRTRGSRLPHRAAALRLVPRALHWWLFEGRRYAGLEGGLCANWDLLAKKASQLLETYNPRWRTLDMPEGEVDWLRTIGLGGNHPRREYICRSTTVGLGEDELRALIGWCVWIEQAWAQYCHDVRVDRDPAESAALPRRVQLYQPEITAQGLRRWAHVAARSRWPFMRDVVAETLRTAIEPQALDRIPLPTNRADLFEMLCLVRILKGIDPSPPGIRWLIPEFDNSIWTTGVEAQFQRVLEPALVRDSEVYGPQLSRALDVFGVGGLPVRSDLLLRFDKPVNGFDGILVEVKSGQQAYKDAVYQLRVYESVVRRQFAGRWLVWAIVESAQDKPLGSQQLDWLRDAAADHQTDSVWAFSDADGIPAVMRSAGITPTRAEPMESCPSYTRHGTMQP